MTVEIITLILGGFSFVGAACIALAVILSLRWGKWK